MSVLSHYLALTLRIFVRAPFATAVNVLTLAAGLFCFLTAYVPLIAVSQIPVSGVNVSVLTEAADIGWRLDQGLARMHAFVDAIGLFGVLRLLIAFAAATALWTLFFAAVFEAFRTLHRLGKGIALLAFACGMGAIVIFAGFVVAPYFGTIYQSFPQRNP